MCAMSYLEKLTDHPRPVSATARPTVHFDRLSVVLDHFMVEEQPELVKGIIDEMHQGHFCLAEFVECWEAVSHDEDLRKAFIAGAEARAFKPA